jgi:hypothetical protein
VTEDRATSALDAMIDRHLPGGCDDCNATQVMSRYTDGLYVLIVHPDSTCPAYRAATGGPDGATT